ncbi:hypothetical protein [Peristeroidobacter soli]|uniref:hypothetical protein n=1 Tax=Peristeroidobacter soli TaxID=2497877 RepID=UPI00101BB2CE|nr:hypothetical protein [Peristeroidobacter soli]
MHNQTDPGWADLAELWRADSQQSDVEVVRATIARRARNGKLIFAFDLMTAATALSFGVWLLIQPEWAARLIGIATIAYAGAGFVLSLWTRANTGQIRTETVHQALDISIRQTRAGIRLASSAYILAALAVAFCSVVAYAKAGLDWRKVGIVSALLIPMLVYHAFALRRDRRYLDSLQQIRNRLDAAEPS